MVTHVNRQTEAPPVVRLEVPPSYKCRQKEVGTVDDNLRNELFGEELPPAHEVTRLTLALAFVSAIALLLVWGTVVWLFS